MCKIFVPSLMMRLLPSELCPALGRVAEVADPGQILFAVDQAQARLPGELDDSVFPESHSLAE